MTGQSDQFQIRRAGADVNAAWKLEIGRDGWYRLSQPDLLAAGWEATALTGSALRVYLASQEVAIAVSTEGVFGSGDALHFFGIGFDGADSRSNAYWLGVGGVGKRMADWDGTPHAGTPAITTGCFRVWHRPKSLYRPYHQPMDTGIDHWFAALVNNTSNTAFTVQSANPVAGQARLQLRLYGLTTGPHQVRIQINGNTVGNAVFDGAVLFSTNFVFSAGLLSDGATTVTLRELNGGEAVYLVDAALDYPGRLHASGPEYYFTGRSGNHRYRVTGLTQQDAVRVLDVSCPVNPVQIRKFQIAASAPGYALEFEVDAATPPYFLVVQPAGVLNAPFPRPVRFRHLGDSGRQADYLMICPYELREQAYRLAKHRQLNGVNVVVAPLPDVVNEFGYGVMDAAAIKQFIGYAYHHWSRPRPRWVVLIGEGTDDPLGRAGSVPSIRVPVRFGPTPFVVAPQDAWYGLVDGDDRLADLAVGRIAVSSNAQLSNTVSKIIAFESAAATSNALLVADNDGEIDFAGSSNTQIESYLVQGGYSRTKVYLPHAAPRPTIAGAINAGRRLVTYVGHGSADRWSAQDIWNNSDVTALDNTVYPVVAVFSCNSGMFTDRSASCLVETFVESVRGAASGVAPTALSVQLYSDYMAAGFSRAFAVDRRRHLGDVMLDAQLNLFTFNPNVAELLTYQIIGDPGLIVNRIGED